MKRVSDREVQVRAESPSVLARVLVRELSKNKERLAIAESCTGGMLGAVITAVSGASRVFDGGVIGYSNELKTRLLGVPQEVIETEGAVSSRVAILMAAGARKIAGSTYGIGITGVAGPTGGTERSPVGTVYIAVKGPTGETSKKFQFSGGRNKVRRASVRAALEMVLSMVQEKR